MSEQPKRKPIIEWAIYKMYAKKDGGPEYWAGPYKSQKRSEEILKSDYESDSTFRIAKITVEFL